MPRVSAEQRRARDALIWQLFLAGTPYRTIAGHPQVRLSCRGVELAIRRQLAATDGQRSLMSNQADAVAVERYEALYRVAYAKAVKGDLRALDQARRLQNEISRLQGLTAAAAAVPLPPPVSGSDDDNVADEPYDELEQWRLRRVGIGVDDGDFTDTSGRGRSRAELIRDADEAMSG
ncbi:hypothetical protein [Mycobacterium noviomagense]|nr:hypothetical protein [Mycobacterium noviomagense]